MADRYSDIVNSPVGKQVAGRLGLPRPTVLRRFVPGQAIVPGPVFVGAVGPTSDLETVLKRARVPEVVTREGEGGKLGAIVVDATAAGAPTDLHAVYAALNANLRALLPSARVIVIGRRAEADDDPAVAATRQAIDGLVRSLAKEMRLGGTVNRLELVGDLPVDSVAVESALRFLLSGKAAYVDGQPVVLGPSDAPAPASWDKPLDGKVAVVTGAARGIGAAIATTLARDGATVVCADLPLAGENLAKVANRIGGTTLQLDITADTAPQLLVEHLRERHGGVDVVVHNAGITKDKLLANMKPEQWDAVIAVNLSSQLRINAALIESGVLHDQSRIVSLSSTTGLAGNRGQTNYGATKAGILGMVRATARQLAPTGSTINAVLPGLIDTDMIRTMPLATREVARRLNSLQQAGLPSDVAEGVAWLASPGAGAVNGQFLRVCGQNMLGA